MSLVLSSRPSHNSSQKQHLFDLDSELRRHGWRSGINALDAESLLLNKPVYTYCLRPAGFERKFAISFVLENGLVKHDTFTLIDPMYGIFRNGQPHHVGQLAKVIRDMMECSLLEGNSLE